jgi:hypothetical protein
MLCEHTNLIGDNYGVTCQNCGQVLEGYGHGGFLSRKLQGDVPCIHGAWYPINATEEEWGALPDSYEWLGCELIRGFHRIRLVAERIRPVRNA